jgi:hypothetical protein
MHLQKVTIEVSEVCKIAKEHIRKYVSSTNIFLSRFYKQKMNIVTWIIEVYCA